MEDWEGMPDFEWSDLWQRWLPKERRKLINHAVNRGWAMMDRHEAAIAAERARRQYRMSRITVAMVSLLVLTAAVAFVTGRAPLLVNIAFLVYGLGLLGYTLLWRARVRRAIERNAEVADFEGIAALARIRRHDMAST